MPSHDFFAIGLLLFLLLIAIPVLGSYLAALFCNKIHFAPLQCIEQSIYRLCNIKEEEQMDWKGYAKALLIFNFLGFLFLFLLLLFQGWLPLNPQHFPGVEWSLALNTAISFVTNTNWQAYGGENTLSYLSQMMGLGVQNFLSAATGLSVLLVFIRGLSSHCMKTLGNFWADLTKSIVYLLLPLSFIFAIVLVSQGVIQNFKEYQKVKTLENETQVIPMGPVASQVAIKQLGTNGGGFFGANSAHPFENPTPFSNFLEVFSILVIPAALVYMYGCMIGSKKQGILILSTMFLLWLIGFGIAWHSERIVNPDFAVHPVLEGKETRFGTMNSALWATATTATANGSVNSMHSSLSPVTGGVAMFNMMLGEIVFGGVGVGLCGMQMFILLTIFLAGLMVGRTPEYLGKKIEKYEMQWVVVAILLPSSMILLWSGISCIVPQALSSLSSTGPHGLSEILYTFSSASGNNGSAFAGLNANTLFYNLSTGFCMLVCRLAILIPSLAIAGSLASKKILAPSVGTFETNSILFAILLISVIFIVGALTFFPAMSLGPIVEQLLMLRGKTF